MAKFKIKSSKVDNSHPKIKIAMRLWVCKFINDIDILDIYGGHGLMYQKVWKGNSKKYSCTDGDALEWINKQQTITQNMFDIDPYASPYEALECIGLKCSQNKIGVICTDGTLRRVAMMRTNIPIFFQKKCGWPERDLTLMAGIYHQYPKFLRYVLSCIMPGWKVERLAIQYGKGTWKQATVYWGAIFVRVNDVEASSADYDSQEANRLEGPV